MKNCPSFYAQRIGAPSIPSPQSEGGLERAEQKLGAPPAGCVSSLHELNRLIRVCGGPEFLCATEAD